MADRSAWDWQAAALAAGWDPLETDGLSPIGRALGENGRAHHVVAVDDGGADVETRELDEAQAERVVARWRWGREANGAAEAGGEPGERAEDVDWEREEARWRAGEEGARRRVCPRHAWNCLLRPRDGSCAGLPIVTFGSLCRCIPTYGYHLPDCLELRRLLAELRDGVALPPRTRPAVPRAAQAPAWEPEEPVSLPVDSPAFAAEDAGPPQDPEPAPLPELPERPPEPSARASKKNGWKLPGQKRLL